MTTAAIAGYRTRKTITNLAGWNNAMLRKLFDIDWQYNIDQADTLKSYATKGEAFKAWKYAFKGVN